MNTKSVMAGEYTAPPAHGPMMAEICGTTPLASVLRKKISAYPASDTTPSWMRAPPESLSPITGAPVFSAMSMILQIFCALASESPPPTPPRAGLQLHVHDLADFLRVGFRKRPAEHREILRENIDQAPIHASVAGHEAVARDHQIGR